MRRASSLALSTIALCALVLASCGELDQQKKNVTLDGLQYVLDGSVYRLSYADSGLSGAVAIPAAVEGLPVAAINDYAFQARAISSVSIPASVKTIGASAFSQCASLETVSFVSGSALTTIGSAAFENCQLLTAIALPDTLVSLGAGAFYQCALTSVAIPAGVTAIPDYCFQNCTALESVTLPSGLLSIGAEAFEDCLALAAIELPEGLTTISEAGFNRCELLAEITLPSTVASIGDYAFNQCDVLATVTCLATSVPAIGEYTFNDCPDLVNIYVPADAGVEAAYEAASYWSTYSSIISAVSGT